MKLNRFDINRIENALFIINNYQDDLAEFLSQTNYSYLKYDLQGAINEITEIIERI